jgi:hypothetical protein
MGNVTERIYGVWGPRPMRDSSCMPLRSAVTAQVAQCNVQHLVRSARGLGAGTALPSCVEWKTYAVQQLFALE